MDGNFISISFGNMSSNGGFPYDQDGWEVGENPFYRKAQMWAQGYDTDEHANFKWLSDRPDTGHFWETGVQPDLPPIR